MLRLDIPYSGNSFTVTTEITSISTNEISINGGTYVLIEGGAFIPDDIAGQFTVTIEWDDVYNTETDCFYVSSTFNKYVCRTERYRGADDPFTTGKIIMRLNNT